MNDKVYLVTFNGLNDYGSEIFAVGTFDSKEKAKKAADYVSSELKRRALEYDPEWLSYEADLDITEMELNKCYGLIMDEEDYNFLAKTSVYLGGYAE